MYTGKREREREEKILVHSMKVDYLLSRPAVLLRVVRNPRQSWNGTEALRFDCKMENLVCTFRIIETTCDGVSQAIHKRFLCENFATKLQKYVALTVSKVVS